MCWQQNHKILLFLTAGAGLLLITHTILSRGSEHAVTQPALLCLWVPSCCSLLGSRHTRIQLRHGSILSQHLLQSWIAFSWLRASVQQSALHLREAVAIPHSKLDTKKQSGMLLILESAQNERKVGLKSLCLNTSEVSALERKLWQDCATELWQPSFTSSSASAYCSLILHGKINPLEKD